VFFKAATQFFRKDTYDGDFPTFYYKVQEWTLVPTSCFICFC